MDSKKTLLSTLSPELRALIETSLGDKLPASAASNCCTPFRQSTNLQLSINKVFQEKEIVWNARSQFSPSELFTLKHAESPGFVVKDNFLGAQNALAVRDALLKLAESETFHEAKIGSGENARNDQAVRGDKIFWIQAPSDLNDNYTKTSAAISYLRKRVESLVYELKNVSPELDVRNVVSTQLAIFPGNGARFVRHLDTYSNVLKDEASVISSDGLVRLVTCVYYLNDRWEPEHGGHLRVHLKRSKLLPACHWDVAPRLDTLVVFRSLDVEHEVLPTYRERKALTIWYYGKPLKDLSNQTEYSKSGMTSVRSPLYSRIENSTNDASIFVAIPSYRDLECRHTVDDLLAQATFPDRVFVGICLQTDDDDNTLSYLQIRYSSSRVRVHSMNYREAAGPCVARAHAQKLWQGEKFYLQIDSHMRFRPGWDCFLINELQQCSSAKPILTTYPLGYMLPYKIPAECRPTLLCASSFDEHGMLRQTSKILAKTLTEWVDRCVYQTHNLLTLRGSNWCSLQATSVAVLGCRVIEEVPYDEELRFLFFGEESSMAARLWTSGWDFFTPSKSVIYHLWTRTHRPVFQELETEETKRCRTASIQFVKQLLGINQLNENDISAEKRTLGRERSFDSYQKHIGVDFAANAIDWRTEWGNLDPILFDLKANAGKPLRPV
ncbi:hypothetical protein PsorP6_008044 [Peronosclerospora sorghi]|uniref:Uncharacterized protein n=1 Tax=Peronosclerospora sorghi TaxID=230839 RepID=A0ACC0WA46_9STRA|nr:hypothetical protein PsorP6_008044 [Peronosclerospora sorghi]